MSNGISQNIPVSRNDIGHFDCVATVIRAENFVSRFPLWFRNIPINSSCAGYVHTVQLRCN